MRYVRNPIDNRVMDMRHVMVVGFGGGNMIGFGVEVVQWLGPYFGKPSSRESSFNKQDYYSNNIGAGFFTYYMVTGKFAYDWTTNFYNWLKQ
jgi:hypothetical protein